MATIYQTASMGEAHVRIAIVAERGKADLLVHRVATPELANDANLWFITRDKHAAPNCIFPCSEGMVELKVCFVPTRCESGWVTQNHRLRERFD